MVLSKVHKPHLIQPIIFEVGFQKFYSNNSVFIRRTSSGHVILIVYVDDIMLLGVMLLVL